MVPWTGETMAYVMEQTKAEYSVWLMVWRNETAGLMVAMIRKVPQKDVRFLWDPPKD
jgi:hypothetical protein